MHLVYPPPPPPPPKGKLHNNCLQFLLGTTVVLWEIEDNGDANIMVDVKMVHSNPLFDYLEVGSRLRGSIQWLEMVVLGNQPWRVKRKHKMFVKIQRILSECNLL